MDHGVGSGSVPVAGSFDNSRVWDVKPLRTLVPIFPSTQSSSFVSASPSGPFPPGVTPFYPFASPPDSQRPEQSPRTPIAVPNQAGHYDINSSIPAAIPITSFPPPLATRSANGDVGQSKPSSGNRTVDGPSQTYSAAAEEDAFSGSQNLSAQYIDSFGQQMNDAEGTSKVVKRRSRRPLKKTKSGHQGTVNSLSADEEVESLVERSLMTFNLMAFDSRKVDGDKDSVEFVETVFNSLRRRITQIEEAKGVTIGAMRRPDLKAGALLMTKGIRTNSKKRVGTVPGVEVGDIFYFRMEMCLLGLHAPSMAGIDYISLDEEPLAVSIVSCEGYEDDVGDGNVLLYSGQGGNIYRKDKEMEDQKLVRGNLALEKSMERGNEVRVVRGIKDQMNLTGRIYIYDGLYKLQESWIEKGKTGCNVFKYKLVRLLGQPEALVIWKSIQQWKSGVSSRVGTILPDLTSGAESLPVSLVNDIDDEKGPAYFTYFPTIKHEGSVDSLKPSFGEPINTSKPSLGCACKGGCIPSNANCFCIKKNGGYLPYTANGVIIEKKSLIHECGRSCPCPPQCKNRVSQLGLKVRLEVFKTKDKGWGLRSWDPIRVGAFVCEYAGEVVEKSKMANDGSENGDDYIFDATRTYQQLDFIQGDSNDTQEIPFPLVITAKNVGNVARFMNHSCTPNVLWQPVLRGDSSESDLHVTFYAIKHVPPMTELTYDYGIIESSNEQQKRKTCLCGSLKCRGYFY